MAERPLRISSGGVSLEGDLVVPDGATAIVVFAHGSGSSRFSPRNRQVARTLHAARIATLLLDLLSPSEERADAPTAHLRFDIGLLAGRLVTAVDELATDADTRGLRLGCFGASTGAGAALVAAAERPREVGAVVSRGGRPDLAVAALPKVRCPTLLIVGGADHEVLALNRVALRALAADTKDLAVVAGATHLFEEAGALEEVAALASDWFGRYLRHEPSVTSAE